MSAASFSSIFSSTTCSRRASVVRSFTSRAMRFLYASLLLSALLFAAPTARAHAFLDHASPAVGSTLQQAPATISLWFTQELEPAVRTVGRAGVSPRPQAVRLGEPGDGAAVRCALADARGEQHERAHSGRRVFARHHRRGPDPDAVRPGVGAAVDADPAAGRPAYGGRAAPAPPPRRPGVVVHASSPRPRPHRAVPGLARRSGRNGGQ